jgi:hypothetical protein
MSLCIISDGWHAYRRCAVLDFQFRVTSCVREKWERNIVASRSHTVVTAPPHEACREDYFTPFVDFSLLVLNM